LQKSVPAFARSDLDILEYEELVSRIKEKTFAPDAQIFSEGVKYDSAIYFVRSGQVTLSSTNEANNHVFTTGGYFGVPGTLLLKLPDASAKADVECVLGVLTRDDIKAVIRNLSRLNQNPVKLKELAQSQLANKNIALKDLKKHRILGVGTFGKVWLVSRVVHGKTEAFALKIQRKRQLIQHNQVEGVIREIKTMSNLDHPFILKLVKVYQDDQTIMMLMSLVQGGELYSVMKKHKSMMLPERDSKFYAACILEGLHYMHYHSILYRDLKPENVLIDKDGYAVIVDLGFAKEVSGKTFTLCGTPWYIAPEVILGRGE